jgi:lipopolysaccharide transport system ATP-binding protein
MSEIAIRVEGLSKRYRIGGAQGHYRYGSLRDSLASVVRAPLNRIRGNNGDKTDRFIWALKDVSFEVQRGEVLGIIGRNGAGKSTLLKILSRITRPTNGNVQLWGRVGSLLEVGTGFHPELSGRENIFLNGAVLGMKRGEIESKFDEIVDFAEIQQFLDTPVKHYSSGMYMRLAFAVAAHLEPEILLVDEVLAVGDTQFQKKCLGKMQEVAKEGRTVLFVSHNLGAIQNMCKRCLLIDFGALIYNGNPKTTIDNYIEMLHEKSAIDLSIRTDRKGLGDIKFLKIEFRNQNNDPIEHGISGEDLIVRLYYRARNKNIFRNCRVSISFHSRGNIYFLASTELVSSEELILEGSGYIDCIIKELPLSKGNYYLNPYLESNNEIQDWLEAAINLHVIDGDYYGTGKNYPEGWEGLSVLVQHKWEWN